MPTLNIKNLPEDLAEKLRERARSEHRSVTQQVIHILTEALEAPVAHSLLELRGLGREYWSQLEAADFVAGERDSWD